MATKTKVAMVDCRPDEVVVVAKAGKAKRVFLANPLLRRAAADQPGYALVPGQPAILPAYMFSGGRDGAQALKSGELALVDDRRGVLPEQLDLADTALRAELRDGERAGPTRQQVLEHYRQKYGEWSLGAAILLLVERAGWPEEAAAEILTREWREAFQRRNGDVTRQSWVRLAEAIVNDGQRPPEGVE